MMTARSLFKKTLALLFNHPSLLWYGALVYLPFIIELWLVFIFIFTLSSVFLGPVAALFLFWPLIVFGFPLFFVIGGFGFTIYTQALLNNKPVSFFTSLKLVFNRATQAWWILPVYFLLFLVSCWTLPGIALSLLFIFVKQLVNDGHTGFSECMRMSWDLFRESCGVLLRFILILAACVGLAGLVSMGGFMLIFFVQGLLSWLTYTLLAITSGIGILLMTSSLALCTSAINLVYYELTRYNK